MKHHIWSMAVVAGFLLPAMAQADELPSWLTERRIIGNNDLEPIEKAAGTPAYDKTRIVARVERTDGLGFCTSSRVADDMFLTNFHCFEFTPCETIQFHLGYEKDLKEGSQLVFRCKEVLAKSENLDYALYRVEFAGTQAVLGTTKSFPFRWLNLAIPDNDTTGLVKTYKVETEGNLKDLKVALKVKHTYISDLTIELASPSGRAVKLHQRTGGDTDNLDKVYTLADGLDVFSGQDPKGEWKLTIKDGRADDTGKLDEISFTVVTVPVDGGPNQVPEDYPTATLSAAPIAVDQLLLVASHPAARKKEIDRSDNCKLRTIVPEDVYGRKTITHMCDTEGGSSGSPILDRETGHIVSLHWGGTDEYNLSIPVSLIVAELETVLSAEVFAELSIQR